MARDGINGARTPVRRINWQYSKDEQAMPKADRRYRVTSTSKLYVVRVECGTAGCTVFANIDVERTKLRLGRKTQVRFEGNLYQLRPAKEFASFVKKFGDGGCGVYVGGFPVEQNTEIEPADFIYAISQEEFASLKRLHPSII